MPISLAHDIHKKRDPLSDYEKKLALADDDVRAVLACPFGCGQPDNPELDEFGLCDHVVGFTNCTRRDNSPTHAPDGVVRNPEGSWIELLDTERDALRRRKLTTRREPLRVGDYLVRVNGTTRRVYREVKVEAKDAAPLPVVPPPSPPSGAAKKTAAPPG